MDLFGVVLLTFFIFAFGAAMGSFLNVLSDRLPNEESILGRSHCENCKHALSWKDLFPIFSFLFLKAKCRYCKTKLSFYYPAVEIVTGILFVITANFLPFTAFLGDLDSPMQIYQFLRVHLVIISALLVIFFADLKYQIIPDSMHTVLIICAVLLRVLFIPFKWGILANGIIDGFLVMLPILILFLATRGRGMGFGDVKLAFVIGILFGLKLGMIVLYFSFLFGAVVGIYLIAARKKKLKSKIAFGPFMVLAMFVGLFFRSQLLDLLAQLWPFAKI
jgi:leader peptidase (prepilin peptidase)/N-methyltransferase